MCGLGDLSIFFEGGRPPDSHPVSGSPLTASRQKSQALPAGLFPPSPQTFATDFFLPQKPTEPAMWVEPERGCGR